MADSTATARRQQARHCDVLYASEVSVTRTDPHAQLVQFWCSLYEHTTGEKYPFNGGRDGKILKDLRELYGDDKLRTLMSAFFEMADPFVEDTGHSLPLFRGCLTKVIAYLKRQSQPQRSASKAVVEPIQAWIDQRKKAANE
jgi:hypothetical protein